MEVPNYCCMLARNVPCDSRTAWPWDTAREGWVTRSRYKVSNTALRLGGPVLLDTQTSYMC